MTQRDEELMLQGIAAWKKDQQAIEPIPVALPPAKVVLVTTRDLRLTATAKPVTPVLENQKQYGYSIYLGRLVIQSAAEVFGIAPSWMCSASHRRPYVIARQAAWLVLYERTNVGSGGLGRVAMRHHTTILYGLEQARLRAKSDAGFLAKMEAIWAKVQQQIESRGDLGRAA